MINRFLKESKEIFFAIIIAGIIRTIFIEPFYIPSPSMNDTLIEGDYVFATKYDYGYSDYSIPFSPSVIENRIFGAMPKRGDVIIFRPPHNDEKPRFIKRLVGLPGDKITINGDDIYINDVKLEHKKIRTLDKNGQEYDEVEEITPEGISYKILLKKNIMNLTYLRTFLVPEGHFFFLGDNRYDSDDSRFNLGYVPFKNLIARARFIFFSVNITLFNFDLSLQDQILNFFQWFTEMRFQRFFTSLEPKSN